MEMQLMNYCLHMYVMIKLNDKIHHDSGKNLVSWSLFSINIEI